MIRIFFVGLGLFILSVLPVWAEEIPLPPEGATVYNLSVSQVETVEQDLLQASLNIEKRDDTPEAVQDFINQKMTEALKTANAAEGVKVSTGSYHVYRRDEYDRRPADGTEPKIKASYWEGRQSIELESKDADTLLDLAGTLQESGFAMGRLAYTLSPEKEREIEDGLLEAAVAQLNRKADRMARALGKSSFVITRISHNSQYPQPVYRGEMMMADMAAAAPKMAKPVADAGESEVRFNLDAELLLRD